MKGIDLGFLAMGGILGTFLRYRMTESPLLLGALQVNVLLVNVVGSFILGLFFVVSQQWGVDTKFILLVAVGFCGSLTTMSAFALETTNLLENKQFGLFAIDVLANVGLSIGAIFAGKSLMGLVVH